MSLTSLRMLGSSAHSSYERADGDFYATDPAAIDALMSVEQFNGAVWECACGKGHLSKRLEEFGHKVISTDLFDRGYGKSGVDFISSHLLANNVVTNPPFHQAQEFVEHAIGLGAEKTAMVLKITFLESVRRKKFFEKHPPRKVAVFSKRLQVAKNDEPAMWNKSTAACYAWFIWHKGFRGRPEILWI
jgi:hypothetical protein